ncbi:TlpA family protein disulfide reductase [Pedobacter frigidisoli]|uniref:TlpA family protein disulfide reductase n=1 Tax=Pedobacter frigidisoli TaxID=2530455 RepID=A0A4R0P036_9SPHI|nr:TlpA disulfide reductase family protein [Pedobacter frigidisoli]TCD08261.1 TlpA family protein disulfide reductase [Pedobacter frigidisoli]
MKTKLFSTLFLSILSVSAFAATITGSRVGANEKSSGFFVEAFSAKGRVLFKSLKFDQNGKFTLDFPTNEALVYWIDNFPVYVLPNQNLDIILPARQSATFVIGGSADQTAAKPTMLTEANIKINGKSEIDNLLINKIQLASADLIKEKKAALSIKEIDQQYADEAKLISKSKNPGLVSTANFYNEMHYMEVKLQYLRSHQPTNVDENFFNIIDKISLNNPAVNSLKAIGLRSLVTGYYTFWRLKEGADIKDDDLIDNGSVGKMEFLLKNVNNERLINEQLSQNIIYHLSISGWDAHLDKIMVAAIEKTTDASAKKNLIELREKYSKVSKNAIAPDFSISDVTGKLVNLSDFKGKVVAIDVWATWCIPCMHSLPYFLKLRDKYKDNPNVVFVSISTDNSKSKDKWLSFLKSKDMNGVELHAGDEKSSAFEKAYNITGIPRYILIDREGKIIEDHAPQASEPEFEKLIETALKSK